MIASRSAHRGLWGLLLASAVALGCAGTATGDLDAGDSGGNTVDGASDVVAADRVGSDGGGGNDAQGNDVVGMDVVGRDVVGMDVVGMDVVGMDVVGADVVGRDVVGADAGTPCGTTVCGAGQACCAATGTCYDPRCLACCMPRIDAGGDVAPGTCTDNSMCGRAEYCAGTGCGTPGTCTALPLGCPRIIDPVCGCDGMTYNNECLANSSGVRAASRGMCGTATDAGTDVATDVAPGGCTDNSMCGRGQYCAGTGCGTPGTCTALPSVCPLIVSPVCGCDGMTYNNECLANSSGVRAASRGMCGTATDAGTDVATDVAPGGCTDNSMCTSRTQYCAGTGCGTPGTCATRPDICPANYNPVCGCDGNTYSNSCMASSAGVRVASRGECPDGGTSTDSGTNPCLGILCARGLVCCPSTGACYDPACLACCR